MWQGNSEIFRAYFFGNDSGDGKSPKRGSKVKDAEGYKWDEVQDTSCFGAVLKSDVVDISFDSKDMYEAFLDMAEVNNWHCLALPSPHGGHTYWKKGRIKRGGKDRKLAVGLVADIHHGSTYIPLRVHGQDRFPPDYDILPGEQYQEVPEELLPVTTNMDLWQQTDGDGRNDDLYGYILVLQSLNIPVDVIRRILTNTNQFVFRDKLDEDELDVILRDEAFLHPTFFDEDGKFQFAEFAEYLRVHHHVVRIGGQLHIYKDGTYVPGYRDIEMDMVRTIPTLRDTQRKETLKYLELIAEDVEPADARYIAFQNGIYDITTGQLLPPSPEVVVTNRIPWNYAPDAWDELADHTLDRLACGDEQIRALLEECIGYCMYRRNQLGKAFILTGDKSNGKSTYLEVVKNLLGEGNISALDLKELGDRFSTAMLFGKLANIGDDIGDDFLQGTQVAVFKKICTGNRIKAERKGQDPFEFNPYVKLLFSANDIPRMRDKTGAVLRRLEIIPFNAVFSEDDPDYRPFIKFELCQRDSMEYLVKIGVQGLLRVLGRNKFTSSEKVEVELTEYEEENNPIVAFIHDADPSEILNQPTADVYRRYQVFCADAAMTPMSKIVFSKQMVKRLKLEVIQQKIGGKNHRIFVKRG